MMIEKTLVDMFMFVGKQWDRLFQAISRDIFILKTTKLSPTFYVKLSSTFFPI